VKPIGHSDVSWLLPDLVLVLDVPLVCLADDGIGPELHVLHLVPEIGRVSIETRRQFNLELEDDRTLEELLSELRSGRVIGEGQDESVNGWRTAALRHLRSPLDREDVDPIAVTVIGGLAVDALVLG
jgi:hypothetical protein